MHQDHEVTKVDIQVLIGLFEKGLLPKDPKSFCLWAKDNGYHPLALAYKAYLSNKKGREH